MSFSLKGVTMNYFSVLRFRLSPFVVILDLGVCCS